MSEIATKLDDINQRSEEARCIIKKAKKTILKLELEIEDLLKKKAVVLKELYPMVWPVIITIEHDAQGFPPDTFQVVAVQKTFEESMALTVLNNINLVKNRFDVSFNLWNHYRGFALDKMKKPVYSSSVSDKIILFLDKDFSKTENSDDESSSDYE